MGADEHNVSHINMPRIGCGLDGLSWPAVRTLIKNVFKQSKVTITVYTLDQDSNSNDSKATTSIKDMFRKGETSKDSKSIVQSPKKDKFTEAKIHFSDGMDDEEKLKRYLIAYGGIIVEDFQLSDATHIIFPDDCPKINSDYSELKHVKYVKRQWLEDSIKLKCRQDERLYKIK